MRKGDAEYWSKRWKALGRFDRAINPDDYEIHRAAPSENVRRNAAVEFEEECRRIDAACES